MVGHSSVMLGWCWTEFNALGISYLEKPQRKAVTTDTMQENQQQQCLLLIDCNFWISGKRYVAGPTQSSSGSVQYYAQLLYFVWLWLHTYSIRYVTRYHDTLSVVDGRSGSMEVLSEFLGSSTIHGLNHISTAKVRVQLIQT